MTAMFCHVNRRTKLRHRWNQWIREPNSGSTRVLNTRHCARCGLTQSTYR